ncbi:Hypothetical predicted protein, partial [Marmota monax]
DRLKRLGPLSTPERNRLAARLSRRRETFPPQPSGALEPCPTPVATGPQARGDLPAPGSAGSGNVNIFLLLSSEFAASAGRNDPKKESSLVLLLTCQLSLLLISLIKSNIFSLLCLPVLGLEISRRFGAV